MNSIKKISIIITFLTFLIGCKSINRAIMVEQLPTKYPVILKYDKKYKVISSMRFPFKIRLINLSLKKRKFRHFKYKYNPYGFGGKTIAMYRIKDGRLSRLSLSKRLEIDSESTNEYIVYSRHFVDTVKYGKAYFNDYIADFQLNNIDTLVSDSLMKFKIKHFELVKDLLDKDSIRISFIKGFGKVREEEVGIFGEKGTVKKQYRNIDFEVIKIPVKW